MKNVVLALMALLIVAMGYFLKVKSDEATALSGSVSKREHELKELRGKLASLDKKVAVDETRLAQDDAQLAERSRGLEKLHADLAAAQAALVVETALRASLKDQEATARAGGATGADPSLAGHIQNDNQRLAEIERQLKQIESGQKDLNSRNKGDAKAYHEQMKAQIGVVEAQLRDSKAQAKVLDSQLRAKRKEKLNLRRDEEVGGIQTNLNQQNNLTLQLQQQVAELRIKESSDTQANSASLSQAAQEAASSRGALIHERDQVRADLANLNSRNGLVKRDAADVTARVNAIRAQEHDSDVKIQGLRATVTRLQGEIAAAGVAVSGAASGAVGSGAGAALSAGSPAVRAGSTVK